MKSERTANGKNKGENNQRNGNPYLTWAFIEAASFAPRFYPDIQSMPPGTGKGSAKISGD